MSANDNNKRSPSVTAQKIVDAYLRRGETSNTALGKAFGESSDFYATLDAIMQDAIDRGEGHEDNGIICADGQTSGTEFIKKFNDILVKQWPDSRPSLPAIAMARLESYGIDIQDDLADQGLTEQEQSLAQAIMYVAARAEMIKGKPPTDSAKQDANHYHCTDHTGHVAEVAGYLAEKNNVLAAHGKANVKFTRAERMMIVLAAFGHDVDHPGTGNPNDNLYFNEDASFAVIAPLMREAGMSQKDMDKIQLLLRTTSPNGPHGYLKKALDAKHDKKVVLHLELDSLNSMPELKPLLTNGHLLEMAAILSDADLFPSAGAGLETNREMSRRLSAETELDFMTDKARSSFIKFIVGGRFASTAGSDVSGDALAEMLDYTEKAIAAQGGKNDPKPS